MAGDAQQGPLGLGERFLKYSIREIVGRGGHAWVYAGRDEFFDRDVAIKVLHRPGGVTPDMVRRGRVEAQLMSRLRHPNVVEVIDAGITNEGQLYIVMELLRGKTLREVLRRRGKLPLGEALLLFIRMTEGVEAAHALNAIHRDLKPENLFVLDDGTPKILDFGIAKVVDSAGFSTAKDVINGTILYMSPEQLQGLRATVRSDVYGVGLMLFEAMLGRHPCLLSNPSPTVRELAFIQRVKQAPLLSELDASIPRHVARAVARAMEKLPEKRIASMRELGATLAACLERLRTEGETEDAPASSMDRAVSTEKLSAAELVPPPHDTHDTEPLATRLFFDSAPAESTAAADDAAEMAEVFGTTHTAPPVITATHTAPQREPSFVLSRRRALRRVAVAGAITGTLIGVALSLALDAPGRRSAGSRPANLGSAPSAPAVPVALAAPAPVNALTPPPTLVTAPPARNPPPVASAAARLPHKKPHASSSVPSEREVWIE